MCGRFTRMYTWREVWLFHQPFRGPEADPPASYNLPPTAEVAVLRVDDQGPLAGMMRWGLIPRWETEPKTKLATFNARSESAATSRVFARSFAAKRCVVPASGFYEWKKLDDGAKQPFYIARADGDPLLFAGLWDSWRGEVDSCTILTTRANDQMSDLHHRMPCILEPERVEAWLDPAMDDAAAIGGFLAPAADGVLTTHPVSRRVGSVRNDEPSLIERV